MNKYKTGDKVQVIRGKDKGRKGHIEKIFPKRGVALVPGINMYKKHVKKTMDPQGKGGIFEIPRPIKLSKLMVLDPKTGKPTRIGFEVKGGKKLRISKKSGELLDKKEGVKK